MAEPAWEVHCQELTEKGPDGWTEVREWQPLSFFEEHRPILDWGPTLSWQPVPGTVATRLVGTVKGVRFFEVRQQKVYGEQAWERLNSLVLVAGPDETRLRPVHVLNSSEDVIRAIHPVEIVAVGDHRGVSVSYSYTGNGGHSARYVYVLNDGRPSALHLYEALLEPLPPGFRDGWERWVSPHHRWRPEGADRHKGFDLGSLTGSQFLLSKDDGRTCWFDGTYTIHEGRLRLSDLKLSECVVALPPQ